MPGKETLQRLFKHAEPSALDPESTTLNPGPWTLNPDQVPGKEILQKLFERARTDDAIYVVMTTLYTFTDDAIYVH